MPEMHASIMPLYISLQHKDTYPIDDVVKSVILPWFQILAPKVEQESNICMYDSCGRTLKQYCATGYTEL